MSDIPQGVLSEVLEGAIRGRRLVSAVLTTFRFDPGFFEQEVLSVLLGASVSHAVPLRLMKLEEELRQLEGEVAVFYDANGLTQSGAGSGRLDVRRIPLQHNAIFHSKNIFLLLKERETDDTGHKAMALLAGCLSANLTRSGWWENVEVGHFEEIKEGTPTSLKESLVLYLRWLRDRAPPTVTTAAVTQLLEFLRSTESIDQRVSGGRLLPRFYFTRQQSVVEFIAELAGKDIRGMSLDVLSPYLDSAAESHALQDLIKRCKPIDVHILLPEQAGQVTCRQDLCENIARLPNVTWGRLPENVVRPTKSEDVLSRFVHAKVYRFFRSHPKREIMFVGSANMTRAGLGVGGNMESGFLVETVPTHRPQSWLEPMNRAPVNFADDPLDDDSLDAPPAKLYLRYQWDARLLDAFWDDATPPNSLELAAKGVVLGKVELLPPREWKQLDLELAARIGDALRNSSFIEVLPEGGIPFTVLVLEEGMAGKPSLMQTLTVREILQYWALLTVEQRDAFVELHGAGLIDGAAGSQLVPTQRIVPDTDSMFDRFAGIFHAFNCLGQSVEEALKEKRLRDADYRLFGRKYDSLGTLLDRLLGGVDVIDPVTRYVVFLCAQQLTTRIRKAFPAYWADHGTELAELGDILEKRNALRQDLVSAGDTEMPAFLDWFDKWFMYRAEPVKVQP